MTSGFSWQTSVSLCPALFCTSRPNVPVIPGIPWLPTFVFQSPVMQRTSFLVLVLEGLQVFIEPFNFNFFGISGWSMTCITWYWLVCLANEQRSFCCFWDCTQVLHFRLFFWLWGLLHFAERILAHGSGYKWSTELNSPIPVHFSSLIPKMLMLTLANSSLTASNLPWFMDLTFQVPMQYCSLQHQTFLPSPVTSTTGHFFTLAPSLRSFWSYFSTELP